MSEMKEKLESAMADIVLNDDDEGEPAAMMDSDLEDDEDEVFITKVYSSFHIFSKSIFLNTV